MSPDTLGNAATLFHEHLSFEWARVRGPNARGNLTGPAKDVNPVLEQLDVALSEGVGCIVDAGTDDVGRDVGFLKQLADGTRVHIVACGGLDMQRTYPPTSPRNPRIRSPMIWCGKRARGGHGAFGEIGETLDAPMSPDERKVFRAVGKAHLRTNLPIFTHNAYGTGPNVPKDAGLRQLDAFESVGVKPQRVAIGHKLLPRRSGGRGHQGHRQTRRVRRLRSRYGGAVPDDKKVVMILAFLEAGYADNLLLSADYNFTARSAARPGGREPR